MSEAPSEVMPAYSPLETSPADEPVVAPSARPPRGLTLPKRGDLPVLTSVRSSKPARVIAGFLITGLCSAVCLMAFAPWQQTVKGSGRVINYDPSVRPQPIESPIGGRVVRLGEGVREMAFVEEGQLIAELADLDPERLTRLQAQLTNSELVVSQAEAALSAAKSELRQAENAVTVYRSQVQTLERVREETLATAGAYVEASRKNLTAAEKSLADREAILTQAEADYRRQKTLYEKGIKSELTFQTAEQKYKSALAAVERAKADVAAAEQEVEAKRRDRETKGESARASIQSAEATVRNAEAKVESSRGYVAKAEQDLRKAENAKTELESSVSRQSNQKVVAPISGVLAEVNLDAGGGVVSQGEMLGRIVPQTEDRVVELYLDGNDAPLVAPGRHVRLQFEGWPAIQFSGWPSVAVGTFGGEVLSVDAAESANGMFRVLVKEVSGVDPESGLVEEPWPQGRFLRPGVRSQAWVLLETVPLWWEVWRNLNGFPPVVDTEGAKPPKRPKLPK